MRLAPLHAVINDYRHKRKDANVSKLKAMIGFIAAILSIGAIVLSAYNHLRVDELRQFYKEIRSLKMEISLLKPVDGSDVNNCVSGLSGYVRIQQGETPQGGTDINMTLAEREIEIVAFVRPLENFQ